MIKTIILCLIGIITAYWWIRWLIATILLPFRVKEIRDLLEDIAGDIHHFRWKLKELEKEVADRKDKD